MITTLRDLGFDLMQEISKRINYHADEEDDRVYDDGEKIWCCWRKNKEG
jgi:hypothetical protein